MNQNQSQDPRPDSKHPVIADWVKSFHRHKSMDNASGMNPEATAQAYFRDGPKFPYR